MPASWAAKHVPRQPFPLLQAWGTTRTCDLAWEAWGLTHTWNLAWEAWATTRTCDLEWAWEWVRPQAWHAHPMTVLHPPEGLQAASAAKAHILRVCVAGMGGGYGYGRPMGMSMGGMGGMGGYRDLDTGAQDSVDPVDSSAACSQVGCLLCDICSLSKLPIAGVCRA